MVFRRTMISLIVSVALVFGMAPSASLAWAEPVGSAPYATDQQVVDSFGPEAEPGEVIVPFAELLADEPAPSVDEADEGALYAQGEVLVSVAPDAPVERVEQTFAQAGVQAADPLEAASFEQQKPIAVEIGDGASVAGTIDELMASDEVVYAQPNYLYTMDYLPNDPVFSESWSNWWHLDDIDAFGAWNIAKVGRTVRVATIDSGVRIDHADLVNNLVLADAYNTVTEVRGASAAVDSYGHGTHVAGLIAAEADNGIGVAGASFNAQVVPINVVYTSGAYAGKSTTADFVEALDYIMQLGDIRIVNISMGTYSYDPALAQSVQTAASRDILIVGAGGNQGNTAQGAQPSYPADLDDALSVTWYSSNGVINYQSDYGPGKDIAAPGASLHSTLFTGVSAYGKKSGSSMAAPVVSGVCALMLSANPDLSVDEIKQILYGTAVDAGDPGWDPYYGWGKINALAAVTEALDEPISSAELSGADRIATSIAIAKEAYPSGPEGVIIVRADDFPDALAASTLAGAKGYPIISCWPEYAPGSVIDYLTSTPSIREAILIGGTGSLSQATESSIASSVPSHRRIYGIDRYDTARYLRMEAAAAGATSDTAVIARGDDFPDALSMSSFTAATGSPLFLLSPTAVPDSAMIAELSGYTSVMILGGYGSVSYEVDAALGRASISFERLAGGFGNEYEETRYGTSATISDWIVNRSGKGFSYRTIAFATARDFPDALAGGPLCALWKAPVLLVNGGSYASVAPAASSGAVRQVYWLGSTNTLSTSVRNAVLALLRA